MNSIIKKEGLMLLIFAAYIIILFASRKCKKVQYIKAAAVAVIAILVEAVFDFLPYWIETDSILIEYSVLQWVVTNIVFVLAAGIIYKLSCSEPSKLWKLYRKRLLPVKIGVLVMFLLGIWLTVLDRRYLLDSLAAMEEALKNGTMDYMFFFTMGDMKSGYEGILKIFEILIPGCLMADFICRKDAS